MAGIFILTYRCNQPWVRDLYIFLGLNGFLMFHPYIWSITTRTGSNPLVGFYCSQFQIPSSHGLISNSDFCPMLMIRIMITSSLRTSRLKKIAAVHKKFGMSLFFLTWSWSMFHHFGFWARIKGNLKISLNLLNRYIGFMILLTMSCLLCCSRLD